MHSGTLATFGCVASEGDSAGPSRCVRPSSVTAIPATEGFLQRMVRQEKVTVRCKRFRGTFLEVVGIAVGGVSLAHKP